MAQKKYTDDSGVSEIWLNIKNYVYSQLLGKADASHTHTKSEITDFPTIPSKTSDLNNDSGFITGVSWDDVSGKPSTFTPSSHTHNYAGSSKAGGAASSTLKLETYKQGSTAETYGANYPIFAQWVDDSNVALKCTSYTVCVDKANSVAWGNVTDKPSFATVATSGSYNDLSNKPTIPTVNNATLTIQKNGTNVATFTANASSNVTANIAVPTKTSELTNDSGFSTLKSLSANSIPFHNSYPRCKYLGSSITDAQNIAIKNRTYNDLFIGDYWTINGVNWRIVAIDYYYNVGDTNFGKGNIIVMPDTVLYNAQMNTTDTSKGGYFVSVMRTQNLNNARTIARNAFGSHLANHRIMLTNNIIDSSGSTNWTWCDSDGVELPNEVQIYGTRAFGVESKSFNAAAQFPLMAFAPQFVNIRQDYWLQDGSPFSGGSFVYIRSDGIAGIAKASVSFGVRPSVTLSYI